MVTSLNQLDPNRRYTYSDYILWKFQERVELLKGQLFPMSAPNRLHQEISSYIHVELGVFLRKNQYGLYSAPFDVRLPLPKNHIKGNKIDTVIQPDLCVVCDKSKLDKQGCVGAPDLVVEILSPGNSKKEMKFKFELYQEAGVLEYWVIDPTHNIAFLYVLDAATNKFIPALPLADDDVIKSRVLPNFELKLSEVFSESE